MINPVPLAPGRIRTNLSRRCVIATFALILGTGPVLAQSDSSADAPADAAPDLDTWLVDLRKEARVRGISDATLDAALAGVEVLPRVIELDRNQPEFTLTMDQYLTRVVPRSRIEQGQRMYEAHYPLLKQVGERYGVQPQYIVALWGIETNYGEHTGGFSVVEALVTLAHDGRRSAYFRKELFDALQIIEDGHITATSMVGSWAGAMGQCQFMPSSFLAYAQDWDGDGRQDIWTTTGDVFASAANYLASFGWDDDYIWGREVRLPANFDTSLADLKIKKRLSEWQALGVRRADGSDLPRADIDAAVVRESGMNGRGYLAYSNYEVILRWNRSTYFATAVGKLSDGILGR